MLMEGVLTKKGFGLFFGPWSERRFVLHDDHVLSYFEDCSEMGTRSEEKKPRGVVQLIKGETFIKRVRPIEAEGKTFAFMLSGLKRVSGSGTEIMILAANSGVEVDAWIDVLKQCLEIEDGAMSSHPSYSSVNSPTTPVAVEKMSGSSEEIKDPVGHEKGFTFTQGSLFPNAIFTKSTFESTKSLAINIFFPPLSFVLFLYCIVLYCLVSFLFISSRQFSFPSLLLPNSPMPTISIHFLSSPIHSFHFLFFLASFPTSHHPHLLLLLSHPI